MDKNILLNNDWIVGFVDGEGCFCISFRKKINSNCGVEVKPRFSVSQNAISKDAILSLEKHFKCGSTVFAKGDNSCSYRVDSLKSLNDIIIPFFDKNSLITNKQKDFLIFQDVCQSMKRGEHLNKDGLKLIIEKACKMNPSGKRKYGEKELILHVNNFKKS